MQTKTQLGTAVAIAGLAAGAAFGWSATFVGAQSVPVNPTPPAVTTPVTPPQPPVAPPPQPPVGPPPQGPIEAPVSPNGGRAGVNTSPNGLPSTGTGAAATPAGNQDAIAFAAMGLALAGAGIVVRRKIHNG